MKINRSITSVLALTLAISGHCAAFTAVKDSFKSATIDTSRWYQFNSGSGKLSQANGRLNFTVANPSKNHDFASMELLSSNPGYNESWDFIIELSNTADLGRDAGCGFQIFNLADRRDFLYVDFYGKKSGIGAGVLVNGVGSKENRFSANLGISKGSIRVRFNKETRLMTFSASLTGASAGYEWRTIGTFSPAGKGGKVNANWKMSPGSGRFGIHLIGFGAPEKVAVGKVTLDNFSLAPVK